MNNVRSLLLRHAVRAVSVVLALAVLTFAGRADAVTITIHNGDAPGEGFNDKSFRTPVGGNPGTTLGAQRMNLFKKAAELWAERLDGDIPIIITASFSPQGGDEFGAVLGFARPTTVHSDFFGVPTTGTWYVAALANQLRGKDQNDLLPGSCPVALVSTHCPEIEANFNSDIDGSVLGGVDFYYGFDSNAGNDIDFLSVLLHEIAHGLGIISLIDQSGAKFNNLNDAYSNELQSNGLKLSTMSNFQRFTAIRSTGDMPTDADDLVWTGAKTISAAAGLVQGNHEDGLKIFAPSTYVPGSSVSHVDSSILPNELMEWAISTPAVRSLDLTVAMLEDMGWVAPTVQQCGDVNNDKKISTADALVILRAAVGLGTCSSVCNVNGIGGVTTGDALSVLRKAVGQNVVFACPA
jgi:hypothetical protein